jgi:hypothetical protein
MTIVTRSVARCRPRVDLYTFLCGIFAAEESCSDPQSYAFHYRRAINKGVP